MPQPALLTFTVNNFKSLIANQGLMITGAGPAADVNVAVTPITGTNVSVGSNGQVTVSRGQQQLNICATGYIPVGLVFKQTAGSTDPNGNNAFGQYTRFGSNSDTLKVTDNDAGSSTYEFYVLIQNPNGDFGLIDPQITNH